MRGGDEKGGRGLKISCGKLSGRRNAPDEQGWPANLGALYSIYYHIKPCILWDLEFFFCYVYVWIYLVDDVFSFYYYLYFFSEHLVVSDVLYELLCRVDGIWMAYAHHHAYVAVGVSVCIAVLHVYVIDVHELVYGVLLAH